MADASQPGELVKMPAFSITVAVVAVIVVVGLSVAFWWWESLRPVFTFAVLASGVSGGLISAFYVWRGLKINADLRKDEAKGRRVALALTLVSRWNDPNLATTRAAWRSKVVHVLDGPSPPDVRTFLAQPGEERTLAVDVLNFFEEVGYAVRSDVADSDTLRAIFHGIVVKYSILLQPWIVDSRIKHGRPEIYAHFEWVRNHWSNGGKT